MLLRHFSKFTNHFEPRERTADKPVPKPAETPLEADKEKAATDAGQEPPRGETSYGIGADSGRDFACSKETSVTIRTSGNKNGVMIIKPRAGINK